LQKFIELSAAARESTTLKNKQYCCRYRGQ